jgi:hypothetical protein
MNHQPHRTRTVGGSLSALALALALTLVLSSLAFVAPAQANESCANEARRVEQRATYLPDCRAYEMVSPPGLEPSRRAESGSVGFQAAVGGERLGFSTEQGGSTSTSPGLYYLSARESEGWSTQGLIPPQSTENEHFCNAYIAAYSPDLSKQVLSDGKGWTGYPHYWDDNGFNNCGHDEPLLVSGEAQGAQNLFMHESGAPSEAGFYQLVNVGQPEPGRNAYFLAGSSDFSHIVFSDPALLTPEAPPAPERTETYAVGEDLYENVGGTVRLVTILPNGTSTWGILANGWQSYGRRASSRFTNAVSVDGERVFFYGAGTLSGERYAGGNLYLRVNAAQPRTEECATATKACTVQVDEAEAGAPGPSGGSRFQWASADGSKVFFTDCTRLTTDATAVSSGSCGGVESSGGYQPPKGNDLYEYDLEKPVGKRLTDLSVDHNATDALGADVQGLAGVSGDGSYVYFVANGVLTGTQENHNHETAQGGKPNLYVRHAGAITYIATLEYGSELKAEVSSCAWSSSTAPESGYGLSKSCLTSRVSPDGRFLAFNSTRRLTSYDNTVAATGKPANEIYLYDASLKELACASCRPDGGPPTAANSYEQPTLYQPQKAAEGEAEWRLPPMRQLSDRGQVFFDTPEALLPSDENNTFDVYEYENGHVHLISSGADPNESSFRGASANGEDVFFTTDQSLVSSDTDSGLSLYDARVGGGFPPRPAVGPGGVVEAPACTSAEACKPPAGEHPVEPFAASSAFSGAGNLVPAPAPVLPTSKKTTRKAVKCPRGKKLVHGKCVKKKPNRSRAKKSTKRRGSK